MTIRTIVLAGAVIMLGACNSGNVSSPPGKPGNNASGQPASTAASSAPVSAMITDDLSTAYDEVWVTVIQVTAVSGDGGEYVLFDAPDGAVFNLRELADVATLLDTADLPAGHYPQLRVTLGGDLTLVDPRGQVLQARFTPGGGPKVLTVAADLSVRDGQPASFALDFDLKQFNYNPATGLATATIVYRDERSLRTLPALRAELSGQVTAVTDSQHFTVSPAHSAGAVAVTLAAQAVVVDRASDAVKNDTAALASGRRVEIYGNYDPTALTMEALRVTIKAAAGDDLNTRDEAEGRVVSFDGSSLVLDVKEASFVPPADFLTVANVSNARFTKGRMELLQSGQEVVIKGSRDGSLLLADTVEIDGAAAPSSQRPFEVEYAELSGRIKAQDGDRLTVTVGKAEHFAVPVGAEMDVDISSAWFKRGERRCLTVGAHAEFKGAVENGAFVARAVKVESGCGVGAADDEHGTATSDEGSSDGDRQRSRTDDSSSPDDRAGASDKAGDDHSSSAGSASDDRSSARDGARDDRFDRGDEAEDDPSGDRDSTSADAH